MNRLTLELDCFMYDGLEEYLLELSGVIEITISNLNNLVIDVRYDSTLISFQILKLEILFYLGQLKVPSIVSFNKHSKVNTKQYNIVTKDLCCEFCFRGMIDDLINIDGIEKVTSDFDENAYYNKEVMVTINYNPRLVKEEELKELELKI